MAGADKLPNMPPAKEPFPGSLTSGWNDPPPLNSAGAATTSSRPRLNHKQRVAFPLDGLSSNNGSNSSTTTSTAISSALNNTPGSGNPIVGPAGAPSTLSQPLSKPIAKVPPQCASVPAQQAAGSHVLPPLPPLPPKADASSWPVATVHPRQK